MGPQGDIPASPGGPLRRRHEKRQLKALTKEAKNRQASPDVATAHIRMIKDGADLSASTEPGAPELDITSEPQEERQFRGFHVRPIPIDQPLRG